MLQRRRCGDCGGGGRSCTSCGNLIRVWHFRQIGGNLKVLLFPLPPRTPMSHLTPVRRARARISRRIRRGPRPAPVASLFPIPTSYVGPQLLPRTSRAQVVRTHTFYMSVRVHGETVLSPVLRARLNGRTDGRARAEINRLVLPPCRCTGRPPRRWTAAAAASPRP